jgi:hypothetical protein
MRARILWICAGLLMPAGPIHAADAATVLRWLAGDWTGNGLSIRIDPERLQANLDPSKPFQWEPFRLRNVTGCMVTFDIGPQRFVALMFRDRAMRINTVGWSAQQSLRASAVGVKEILSCPEEPKPEVVSAAP